MVKAVRLQREGVLPETDDPLVLELAKAWIKCCDEVGYEKDIDIRNPLKPRCPVKVKCDRLWLEIAGTTDHALSLTEYRQYSQRFALLKQERDRLLSPGKPA